MSDFGDNQDGLTNRQSEEVAMAKSDEDQPDDECKMCEGGEEILMETRHGRAEVVGCPACIEFTLKAEIESLREQGQMARDSEYDLREQLTKTTLKLTAANERGNRLQAELEAIANMPLDGTTRAHTYELTAEQTDKDFVEIPPVSTAEAARDAAMEGG